MKVFLSDVVNCSSHDSNQRRHRSKASAWTACRIVCYRYLDGFIRSYPLSRLGVDILEPEFCMDYRLIGWPRSPRPSSVYLSRHKDSSESTFKAPVIATANYHFHYPSNTIYTPLNNRQCHVFTWGSCCSYFSMAVNLSRSKCPNWVVLMMGLSWRHKPKMEELLILS